MLPVKTFAASSSEIQQQINGLKAQNAEIQKEIDAVQRQFDENFSEMEAMAAEKNAIDQEMTLINSKIEIRTESVPFEEISVYLDAHDRYAVMDCMCRTIHKAHGKACGHSIKDMCILIGSSVDYYVRI